MASISRDGGRQLQPDKGDLSVTAGWGHGQKGGVVMPGKGRTVERDYAPDETKAIKEGAKALGLTQRAMFELLGETTLDVYLNEVAFWRNVPVKVWNYHIGGYQVIKKWLSCREKKILGRDLTPGEARYVTDMTRRIAAIVPPQGDYPTIFDGVVIMYSIPVLTVLCFTPRRLVESRPNRHPHRTTVVVPQHRGSGAVLWRPRRNSGL